jgi:hypothetical protein
VDCVSEMGKMKLSVGDRGAKVSTSGSCRLSLRDGLASCGPALRGVEGGVLGRGASHCAEALVQGVITSWILSLRGVLVSSGRALIGTWSGIWERSASGPTPRSERSILARISPTLSGTSDTIQTSTVRSPTTLSELGIVCISFRNSPKRRATYPAIRNRSASSATLLRK